MFSILVGYLTLLLFLVSTAAVDDHYISNGTCYYKAGAIADNSYAPVGNIIYGHTYCCALGGDKINNNNACYDDSSKSTRSETLHCLIVTSPLYLSSWLHRPNLCTFELPLQRKLQRLSMGRISIMSRQRLGWLCE